MYDFLRPINIRGSSCRWSASRYMTPEIERDQILRKHGKEYLDQCIKEKIEHCLTHGFAIPNGTLAWTTVFTDLSEQELSRLAEIETRWDRTGLARGNKSTLVKMAINIRFAHTRRLLGERNWLPSWITEEDELYCATLAIVNVGVEESNAYTNLADVCSEILAVQFGKTENGRRDEWQKYADPAKLKINIHEYIDRLVRMNNEVQHFCSYIRQEALEFDVEYAHSMEFSDDMIARIALSAPAVLFTGVRAHGDSAPPPSTFSCGAHKRAVCPV